MQQFQIIPTNLSVNISINSLRQNLLNLVSSPTLIWYLKVDRQFKTLKNRKLTTILMISEHNNSKLSDPTSFIHHKQIKKNKRKNIMFK